MRRIVHTLLLVAVLVLALAPAAWAVQPTNVVNADGRDGGASAPGPHCRFNLMASANNRSPHGMILTGAIHQAHTQTGLPTGIFQATACV
ncbi:MAG: hypothetical protein L0Z49_14575, partial [Actinobacteria bacterium]|nr:hypothetical protein [Actinomycetota bacterium]